LSLGSGENKRELEIEAGLVAQTVGQNSGSSNRAQRFDVTYPRDDGTEGDEFGGFSVPTEMAKDVAAGLIESGHSVE
jgi:hypothetical protein